MTRKLLEVYLNGFWKCRTPQKTGDHLIEIEFAADENKVCQRLIVKENVKSNFHKIS